MNTRLCPATEQVLGAQDLNTLRWSLTDLNPKCSNRAISTSDAGARETLMNLAINHRVMVNNTDNASFAGVTTPSRSLNTRNIAGRAGTLVQMPNIQINKKGMALNNRTRNRVGNRDMIEFVVDK